MQPKPPRNTRLQRRLERLRLQLARPDTLLPLAMVGLITGLLAGVVIVAFRLAVEGTQAAFLAAGDPENYETLPLWLRFALPALGGAAIGYLFHKLAKGDTVLGVARVMERLAYHQGHLDRRGFVLQFVGAALAIISGHSVGREGPHVYLGAASGSLLGQSLSLPNNSIRTMVGCGTAAGIAASFNTPLAGVIFALEVVMMEYTLASFTPVILAAVSANAVSIAVFGASPAFDLPHFELGSLAEMPALVVLGLVIGALAAAFIHILQWITRRSAVLAFGWRTSLAGVLVGGIAVFAPGVMGIGYDTVNAALLGELSVGLLALLVAAKLIASAISVGMGIPGGLIGPTFFIGAAAGGLGGLLVAQVLPGAVSDSGFYALLGMGAMMGATLQAPLAALTALVELTQNPAVIMPGMLAITIAGLTASEIFNKEALFVSQLKANGLDYNASPVMQALRRVGVAGVMSRNFQRVDPVLARSRAEQLLAGGPDWLLIDDQGRPALLMRALDLVRHLREGAEGEPAGPEVDLREIPARRLQVVSVNLQASLHEALETLNKQGGEALYVERMTVPGIRHIYGILTREQIESSYLP